MLKEKSRTYIEYKQNFFKSLYDLIEKLNDPIIILKIKLVVKKIDKTTTLTSN